MSRRGHTVSCCIQARVWRGRVEEPTAQKLGESSLGRLSWVGGQAVRTVEEGLSGWEGKSGCS